jgi:hypothetical protein
MDEKFLAKTGFFISRKFYIQMEGLKRRTIFRGFPLKFSVGLCPTPPMEFFIKSFALRAQAFIKNSSRSKRNKEIRK